MYHRTYLRWMLTGLLLCSMGRALPQSAASLVMQDMAKMGGVMTQENSLHLLMSGHAKFDDMFRELRKARQFIHMEYFNFRNDSINDLLISLLAEKAREGVEVRVMYDAFGNASNNQPIKRHQHDSICALGVHLEKFDPLRFPWFNHIYPRDHRKIVVIDGEVAYSGGMNVADYYIDGLEGIGPWRDMHMHIEGAAVDELHKIFAEMWYKQTGELIVGSKYFPHDFGKRQGSGNVSIAIVDRKPRVANKAIRQLYVSMLDHAQHHVRIINPYFVPTHAVRSAIKRAIDRGVRVEIMLSAKSDIPLTPDASFYVGNNLMKRGATVYLFNNGFHHTKTMTVDDEFCTIGSANLNSRSLRYDYEVNTVIFDRGITAQLDSMFLADVKQSTPMTRTYWRKKSFWRRTVSWFGNLLTPFL